MDALATILQQYEIVADVALYFLVFAVAARAAFARSFQGSEGKILAVAGGLLLAVALGTAQRVLGFSLEALGPVAIFVLSSIIFIASYKFLQGAEIPFPLSALIAVCLQCRGGN
jgi:hypothetical protein